MDKTETVKTVVKGIMTEELPIRGEYDGMPYEATFMDSKTLVKLDGVDYEVTGTKRLLVKAAKKVAKKATVKKAPKAKAADTERKCVVCGEVFKVSKFNPYFDKCKDHRKNTQVHAGVDKKCEECGKSFKASRYTPYQKFCDDCRKAHRKAKAKPKAKAKAKK